MRDEFPRCWFPEETTEEFDDAVFDVAMNKYHKRLSMPLTWDRAVRRGLKDILGIQEGEILPTWFEELYQRLLKKSVDLQNAKEVEGIKKSYGLGFEVKIPTPEFGRKDDSDKDRWDLLPLEPVRQIVKVLTFGAKKYAPDNWQKVSEPRDRYFAALMRHLVAWRSGEALDPESGIHHLAHAGCCVLFLLWFELRSSK